MAGVFRREAFTLKNVAQMSATVSADDLGPLSVGIRPALNRPLNGRVKARPAAVSVKLVLRTEENSVAPLAPVDTLFKMIVILTGKRRFGPPVNNDPLLFGRQITKLLVFFGRHQSIFPYEHFQNRKPTHASPLTTSSTYPEDGICPRKW